MESTPSAASDYSLGRPASISNRRCQVMRTDQPAPEKSDRKSAGTVIATVAVHLFVVLPAIYVLGLGPAVQIHKNGSPTVERTIEVAYFWVPFLQRFPALQAPLEWYVR